MVKNLCNLNLSNEKTLRIKDKTLLSLITGMLGKKCWGRSDKDLNKWNRGNMPLT